jgi:hypothetical protein
MAKNYGNWPAFICRSTSPATPIPTARCGGRALEVAIKIKGSQGQPRVEWLKIEHPWTALSAIAEVHANHLEAFNSALRRRATAYRRRQNHYAKQVEGLQRALDVQRLMHNWVRPHWSLGKQTTPAMAMGFIQRPLKLSEILVSRGLSVLHSLTGQCLVFGTVGDREILQRGLQICQNRRPHPPISRWRLAVQSGC